MATVASQKCGSCNNITTNDSGRCYLHESSTPSGQTGGAGVPPTPPPSTPGADDRYDRFSAALREEATEHYLHANAGPDFNPTEESLAAMDVGDMMGDDWDVNNRAAVAVAETLPEDEREEFLAEMWAGREPEEGYLAAIVWPRPERA